MPDISIGSALQAFIQVSGITAAFYVGLTRITDNKHHPHDVLVGFIIGAAVAVFAVSFDFLTFLVYLCNSVKEFRFFHFTGCSKIQPKCCFNAYWCNVIVLTFKVSMWANRVRGYRGKGWKKIILLDNMSFLNVSDVHEEINQSLIEFEHVYTVLYVFKLDHVLPSFWRFETKEALS